MGIKFGEIDASQILDNEYRIGVLELIVQKIASGQSVGNVELQEIRKTVVERLQKKYPNSGIELK
ncbi:hypothetical protein KC865_01280 [Candidatus Kaiserbacteria bacterium]|nr:hypothetical protein [Candidatus Kaiserbacteria bacterium]MCA9364190.1 hypothetical protein [Candidatus Kaiserbacteria bacterium]